MAANRFPRPLSAALAFGLALALWALAGEAYHSALGLAARVILTRGGSGAIFVEPGVDVVYAAPVSRPESRMRIPLTAVTPNLVLLATLWGWSPPRRPSGFAWGLGIVVAAHLFAVIAGIHANLALARGSGESYGILATNLWFIAWQGYQVVGAWAIAFGAWWSWSGGPTPSRRTPRAPRSSSGRSTR